MSADANPIEYWTPDTPRPALPPGQGQVTSMFTGPDRVGCATMLVVVVLASGLAIGIVTALAWVLA
jgi:hypothetical protein